MPNRFRVLDCFIERTGEASSVSGSLSESESNPLIDQSSQLDTNPSFRPRHRHRLSIQKPGSACFSETADFDSLALAPLRTLGLYSESLHSLKAAPPFGYDSAGHLSHIYHGMMTAMADDQ